MQLRDPLASLLLGLRCIFHLLLFLLLQNGVDWLGLPHVSSDWSVYLFFIIIVVVAAVIIIIIIKHLKTYLTLM